MDRADVAETPDSIVRGDVRLGRHQTTILYS